MITWTALFLVLVVVAAASPFFLVRGREPDEARPAPPDGVQEALAQVAWALGELEADADAGKISDEDRRRLRAELEQKLERLRAGARSGKGSGSGGISRG